MWYLKAFGLLALAIVLLFFTLANSDQNVVIRGFDSQSSGLRMNLAFALLGAYVLGLVTFFIISAARDIGWRSRCAKLRRDLESMRRELDVLRTAPLDGPLESGPPSFPARERRP